MTELAYKCLRFVGIKTHRKFRLTIRLFSLVVGLSAGFYLSVLLAKQEFETIWYWFSAIMIAALVEFVFADVLADHSFPFDTERKLALMEQRLGAQAIKTITKRIIDLINEFRGCDTAFISGTVHVFAELTATADQRIREGLLQLTDYIGPDGGKKGRITLINQGIIGRCARTGEMETVNFADEDEYREAMVREFGFTIQEADRHTKTGRSYFAFPLRLNNKVVGVLYFFSSEPQVFPLAADTERTEEVAAEIVNYMNLARLV